MEQAVNFTLGSIIGFLTLVIVNLVILAIRATWFNTPDVTHQKRITDSLKWCIFWSKFTLAGTIIFFILYAIMVN